MDRDTKTQAPADAGAQLRWRERWRRLKGLVPTVSVLTVVVAALAATVMVTYPAWQDANRPPATATGGQDVVRAPPLVGTAPPLRESPDAVEKAQGQPAARADAASALGAGPACRSCGVVESVTMVNQQGTFQMRIRMDDGTLRTVEQRGAVAAGSRVLVEGGSVRIMMAPGTRQG
ncbi:MAG TPA: hypothetical protein VNN06_10745 [Ramlibacter sp.]|nr:hypothetical protein [Ramlibacter sp.]